MSNLRKLLKKRQFDNGKNMRLYVTENKTNTQGNCGSKTNNKGNCGSKTNSDISCGSKSNNAPLRC